MKVLFRVFLLCKNISFKYVSSGSIIRLKGVKKTLDIPEVVLLGSYQFSVPVILITFYILLMI